MLALAHGQGNVESARELGVSLKTVQNHVSHVLAKLHLRDRTQPRCECVDSDTSGTLARVDNAVTRWCRVLSRSRTIGGWSSRV